MQPIQSDFIREVSHLRLLGDLHAPSGCGLGFPAWFRPVLIRQQAHVVRGPYPGTNSQRRRLHWKPPSNPNVARKLRSQEFGILARQLPSQSKQSRP